MDIQRHEDSYTLLELIDRIFDKGVVIAGDITISLADVDLLYLGVKIVATSVENMEKNKAESRICKDGVTEEYG